MPLNEALGSGKPVPHFPENRNRKTKELTESRKLEIAKKLLVIESATPGMEDWESVGAHGEVAKKLADLPSGNNEPDCFFTMLPSCTLTSNRAFERFNTVYSNYSTLEPLNIGKYVRKEIESGKVRIVGLSIGTGEEILKAAKDFQEAGLEVVSVIAALDEDAGGVERLVEEGYEVSTALTATEMAQILHTDGSISTEDLLSRKSRIFQNGYYNGGGNA